jgi:hypothetical protein
MLAKYKRKGVVLDVEQIYERALPMVSKEAEAQWIRQM